MKGETVRYSAAFKQKVVSELESGKFQSMYAAEKVYGVSGTSISNWIKKLGKNHLLDKVVRVEMKDERDRIKALEKEKQKLESALAQEHLKVMALETLVDLAKEEFAIDLKKNYGADVSRILKRR